VADVRALLRVVLFPGVVVGSVLFAGVWLAFANGGPLLDYCPKRRMR
jgi:hypothetical protein